VVSRGSFVSSEIIKKKTRERETEVGFGVRVFEWLGASVNVLEFNLQGIVLRWTNQDCFSAF
jgi:hypothetical protein